MHVYVRVHTARMHNIGHGSCYAYMLGDLSTVSSGKVRGHTEEEHTQTGYK